MAEIAIPQALFAGILRCIDRIGPPATVRSNLVASAIDPSHASSARTLLHGKFRIRPGVGQLASTRNGKFDKLCATKNFANSR
jgi:hypothetical protein